MPVFSIDQLRTLSTQVLLSAGVPARDAATVADELATANAFGHDSHGVIRLIQYVDLIQQGFIVPGATVEVVRSGGSMTIFDAHFNFGQVAARAALEAGLRQAQDLGTSTVMVRNCNHVGRLGSYAQQAALRGFASMMAVNAPGPGGVAPWGGIERKLGTNPISMSGPWGDSALVLDMTTSATAEGKIRVAYQKGESVAEGLLIDAAGHATTDPAKLYADPPGAILPLGGPLGFKGYGLSVMIDVFGGILSGSGVCRTDLPRGANGVWMYFLDIDQFLDRSEYDSLIATYVENLRSSRKQSGVAEILMPGEIENRREMLRRAEGVDVPDETWRQITELADRLGTDLRDMT
ncbi:MAG: Ldh family oxidoreductase [Planctomycetaceae bacterium]